MKYEIAPKSTEIQANWDDARLYCFALNIDGKTGWRLPTKEELNEIYESQNDFKKTWYWSSTVTKGNYAWFQLFGFGGQHTTKKSDGLKYVRAIRDLKDN
jgi:hypothetical protein